LYSKFLLGKYSRPCRRQLGWALRRKRASAAAQQERLGAAAK
jgi:hypothetical protein